ncbi:MAG TPA: hypothetical protein VKR56_05190 [Candidatus Cybelea sp.]|nr:hypothetical protein [Candidatus Cybelea sp.]
MRFVLGFTFCILCTASPGFAGAPPSLSPISWLVGKTWTAQTSGGPSGIAHIDTRYEWAVTQNFVQFTTRFVGSDGTLKRSYAGMFYVDPTRGVIVWYIDSGGTITTGPVTLKPDSMEMTFSQEGTPYVVDVARQDARSYRWTLFERGAGGLQKDLTLNFVQTNALSRTQQQYSATANARFNDSPRTPISGP